MDIRIPKSFKLFNQTIKVIYRTNLLDKHDCFGMWDELKNVIYLQKSTRKYKLNKEQIFSTFCHEYLHCCLDLLGYHKISSDEKFVSSLSHLIDQLINITSPSGRT